MKRALPPRSSSYGSSHQEVFNRGSALLLSGELGEAADLVEKMAESYGETAAVLWLKARLALARRDGRGALSTLERQLQMSSLSEAQRAESDLLAGLALDMIGDAPAAFAAAASGKARQRRLYADIAAGREGEVAKLRRIARRLAQQSRSPRPTQRSVPGAAATHVFILGFPRSGTTLLEQILAAHPDVETLEEEDLLAGPYQAFLSTDAAIAALDDLVDAEAEAWAEHYWRDVRRRGLDIDGRVFIDKQPAGTIMLPVIARLFPDARIVFALRDPRDVVLSCFRQPFALNAMTYAFTDLTETAWCYDACMTLAAMARQRLPLAWMDLRHEALIDDVDTVLIQTTRFLGLAPAASMSDFVNTAQTRTIRTPSAAQVREGINRRGIGRWQAYRAQCAAIMPIVDPWVERLGYPPDPDLA